MKKGGKESKIRGKEERAQIGKEEINNTRRKKRTKEKMIER